MVMAVIDIVCHIFHVRICYTYPQCAQVVGTAAEDQGPLQARLAAAERRAVELQARVDHLEGQQGCVERALQEAKAAQQEAAEQRRLLGEARAQVAAERAAAVQVGACC